MSSTVRNLGWLFAACLCLLAAYAAGHVGLTRVEQSLALQCARASDGTDAAICDCYTHYGLEVPEDMQ